MVSEFFFLAMAILDSYIRGKFESFMLMSTLLAMLIGLFITWLRFMG